MDHLEAGRYWDGNAEAWTKLARAGYDIYRDYLNTPAFFAMLPDVAGLNGLDIGCGEGHNTRLLAAHSVKSLVGIDISPTFLCHAASLPEPRISYANASAVQLPFADRTFDFATAFMSLMDVPETEIVIREAYRVLQPGGFLQFSISHPCFSTLHRRNLRGGRGTTYAIEVAGYFNVKAEQIDEWTFSSAPPEVRAGLTKFRTPRFIRTLSQWFNFLVDAGFVIERVEEPQPTPEALEQCPKLQDAQVVAYFLHIRVRRPA
jgi:ubiquinone/menaquinone biosynthesis C-methylase UbiE